VDIRFEITHIDYRYAIQLKTIIRLIEKNNLVEYFDPAFIEKLKDNIESFLSIPEVAGFSTGEKIPDIPLVHDPGLVEKIKDFFGPGKREKLLSKQRIELIERAEHAENTAFETLAELADLKNKLESANITINELKKKISRENMDK
jgi:hypothetical protein